MAKELAVRKTRTINIGKGNQAIEYAKVSARIAELHKDYKNAAIKTEFEFKDGWAIFKANLILDVKNPDRVFNGTSMGKVGAVKAFEKLETIAVGRALALAGFLSDGEIASSEEMASYEESVDIVEQNEVADATVQLESAHTLEELGKVWRSFPQAWRNNAEILNLKNQLKAKYENPSSEPANPGMAAAPAGEDNGNGTQENTGND